MKLLPTRRLLIPALVALLASSTGFAAAEKNDALFPMPDNVKKIVEARCVMCHGETHDGKVEIREDLNLSSEEAIRETLSEAGRLKEVIAKNQMPQKAKLSFRLRKNSEKKQRLEAIKAEYEKNGEKEVLMAWLKDVVATETPDKKDKKSD